ncbi:MAG: Spy/CpxP family protein refolding chaperone [Candidatus Aminicenantales bacterium]
MKNKFRFWTFIFVLVAFAAGLLGGFWVEHYFAQKKRRFDGSRPSRETVHFPSLELMSRELSLTADQQERIRQIFERNDARLKELRSDMHSRLTEIRAQLKSELEGVLTPEQRQKFEAMIAKYLLQRKRDFEKRKEQGDRR